MDNNECQPLLLSTQELLAAYWPQVEPLLEKCPIAEDISPTAILNSALAGQMFLFVVKQDTVTGPEVELVMAVSPVLADKLPVMNIVAVAGKNLKKHAADFWQFFVGWCYINGVRAIDAYVPESMELMVQKLFGLVRETIHVRLRI